MRMTDSMNRNTSGETRKKEVKKLGRSLNLYSVLILETELLLEWSVRCCLSNFPRVGRALLYVGANFLACALTRFS